MTGTSLAQISLVPNTLPQGTLYTNYDVQINATGFTGPYTLALSSGSLPAGLSLSSSGRLSGSPTASGNFPIQITATEVSDPSTNGFQDYTLTINSLPVLTPSIAAGTVGAAYNQSVAGGGGTLPVTYSLAAGSLPAGLSLASNGTISGTPTAGGTFAFSGRVTDANGATTILSYTLPINPPTISLSPASLSSATVGVSYSQNITASNGTAPYRYAITAGALPAGLTLGASGVLSGTPMAAGPFNFTVTATDSSTGTGPFSGSASYTLSVAAATSGTSLTSSRNPSALGQSVTFTATVTGNSPTGTVTFKDGGTTLATVPLSGVTASFTTSSLTAGSHPITAVYSGDVSNAASTSPPMIQNVGAATTATTLSSSANPSTARQPVTFTATVSSGGGTPTGTVTFADGGATLGTAMLVSGVASFTTSSLATGTHAITASYAGGASFAASTSAILNQAVNVPADSIRLRQMQLVAAPVIAQNSGQAIAGAVDSAISDGFSGGGNPITPSGSGIRFNFSADPDEATSSGGAANAKSPADAYASNQQNRSRVDDAFAAIDRGSLVTKAPPRREQKDWLLWADVSGSGIERWNASAATGQSQLYGAQVNALLGLTRRVTPNFLLGIFGGYENFDYASTDIGGKLKGDGWTLGSYLGWKLTSSVRFDAAVAYSGIGYDGTAGLAQGNFDGRRWLVSSGFTGTYKAMGFDIEPSAKVYALWEHENAYTDSLGTLQGDRDFATGRASGGVKLIYPFGWNALALAPYVGLYGDYYFTEDNAAVIVAGGGVPLASTPLLDGWSARVTGGLAAKLSSGATVAFGGELGGIGSNTAIWTARARASLPF